MTAHADPLFVAIERLTTKHTESERLPGGVGMHYAKHEPLIKQLRDAIGGDVGYSGGGGAQAPSARTPIDPDALKRYMDLVVVIQDFHSAWVKERPPVDELPEVSLARAYRSLKLAIEHKTVPDGVVSGITAHWEAQGERILTKMSPPTTRELIGFPCPACGVARVRIVMNRSLDPRVKAWEDSELHVALTVVYRPDSDVGGGLGKSSVHCVGCGEEWTGDHGIRYVANELERFEARAIELWAEHDHIPTGKNRVKRWAEEPIAKRELWMLTAFKDLNPPTEDDPEGITPDGEVADHILTPTGAPE